MPHKIPWTIENKRFNEENKSTAHAKPRDPGRSEAQPGQILSNHWNSAMGDILCFSMFGLTIVNGGGRSTTMNCYWKYRTKKHTEVFEFAKTSTNLAGHRVPKSCFWNWILISGHVFVQILFSIKQNFKPYSDNANAHESGLKVCQSFSWVLSLTKSFLSPSAARLLRGMDYDGADPAAMCPHICLAAC